MKKKTLAWGVMLASLWCFGISQEAEASSKFKSKTSVLLHKASTTPRALHLRVKAYAKMLRKKHKSKAPRLLRSFLKNQHRLFVRRAHQMRRRVRHYRKIRAKVRSHLRAVRLAIRRKAKLRTIRVKKKGTRYVISAGRTFVFPHLLEYSKKLKRIDGLIGEDALRAGRSAQFNRKRASQMQGLQKQIPKLLR